MQQRIDELLRLIELEPDGLAAAEFLQAQTFLERLAGKTIAKAAIEETRVTIETTDGCRYHFYGFLGLEQPQ